MSASPLEYADHITDLADAFYQVTQLQRWYSAQATPEMQIRGRLIRKIIPNLLAQSIKMDALKLPTTIPDWKISASDGISAKAQIPWVRLHSQSYSPRATAGRYLVYLFDAQGENIFLSLSTGAMQLIRGRYQPRPKAQLKQVIAQSRQTFAQLEIDLSDYRKSIKLGATTSQLGKTYEQSTIAAIRYSSHSMPDSARLMADLNLFIGYLTQLYGVEQELFQSQRN